MNDWAIVVPWVTEREISDFLNNWNATGKESWLILQQDIGGEGCAVTKNNGIAKAVNRGAEIVIVLDGDCYPNKPEVNTLLDLASLHRKALEPQEVNLFEIVTDPPSRGTPYYNHSITVPVAASMGFWTEVGDYCAVRQLVFGADNPMSFKRVPIFWRWFPLCGMNLAFKPNEWLPWCRFIDVARFDDIWMGWLWQREAYRRGYCFNLAGPIIRHSRQSNVWSNLDDEMKYLMESEGVWKDIATATNCDYESLRKLLPLEE